MASPLPPTEPTILETSDCPSTWLPEMGKMGALSRTRDPKEIGNMTVTKEDLCEAVMKSPLRLTASQAKNAVESVFETLKETMERGENVKLTGFGVFTVRNKRTRTGRNPKTGESIEIAARRVVTFKASPLLKVKMNGKTKER